MGIKKIARRAVKRILVGIYRIMNSVLKKDPKTVVFSSTNGKAYAGSPRAVFEYMREDPRFADYTFVWFLTEAYLRSGGPRPEGCRVVCYGHPVYYYFMARAGKWVFDTRQERFIDKKPGVKYLQTWHGTPLKKLGADLDGINMGGEQSGEAGLKSYVNAFITEAAKWDWLISQCSFTDEVYPRCFGYSGELLRIGYPRNDVLVRQRQKEEACGREKSRYKTILYAPTWRDDKYIDGGWYRFCSDLDFRLLEKELGSEYRIFIKLHYLMKLLPGDIPKSVTDSGFVTVCGNDRDIAELYTDADMLITDYSSVMFDYSLLGRPMLFYAYDLENYRDKLRGFYFDFEREAPGPVSLTTEQLIADIKGYSEEKYKNRLDAFKMRYNTYENGNAAAAAAEVLL